MFSCKCGKTYKYKHKLLEHKRFWCKNIKETPKVLEVLDANLASTIEVIVYIILIYNLSVIINPYSVVSQYDIV